MVDAQAENLQGPRAARRIAGAILGGLIGLLWGGIVLLFMLMVISCCSLYDAAGVEGPLPPSVLWLVSVERFISDYWYLLIFPWFGGVLLLGGATAVSRRPLFAVGLLGTASFVALVAANAVVFFCLVLPVYFATRSAGAGTGPL
jgi:hypothetical protein